MGRFGRVRGWLVLWLAVLVVVAGLPVGEGVSGAAPVVEPVVVSVGSVSVVEGDAPASGRQPVRLPLTLSGPAAADVVVSYEVSGGSATEGEDFEGLARHRRAKIKAGGTHGWLTVVVFGDSLVEGDESVEVSVSVVSGPAVVGSAGVGSVSIVDDDPGVGGPVVSVGSVSVVEGDVDGVRPQVVRLPFTLSAPVAGDVVVTWEVVAGSATAGEDFLLQAMPRSSRIRAGRTRGWAPVVVLADDRVEGSESFGISITGVSGAASVGDPAVGSVTILDPESSLDLYAWGDGWYPEVWEGARQIGTWDDWTFVEAGTFGGFGIRADGSLWAWGSRYTGLGGSASTEHPVTQVGTGTDWVTVSSGVDHTLGVRADGSLWAWGANGRGQLGLGDTASRPTPTRVGTGTDWESVSAGPYHALGLRQGGTLWAWGSNTAGQLGLGGSLDRWVPTQVGTDGGWAQVAAGNIGTWVTDVDEFGSSFAVRADGTLWKWGYDPDVDVPTRHGTESSWVQVTGGPWTAEGLRADGSRATVINGLPGRFDARPEWVQLSAGGIDHRERFGWQNALSFGIRQDGTLWVTVGTQYTDFDDEPRYFGTGLGGVPATAPIWRDSAWASFHATAWTYENYGIRDDGRLFRTHRCCPSDFVELTPSGGWADVEATSRAVVALRADGTVWSRSVLSEGTVLTQVGTETDWVDIAITYNRFLGVRADGSLWAWGYNGGGFPLAGGPSYLNNVPARIGTDSDWVEVEIEEDSAFARKADGSLWAWGKNNLGQLGLGDTATRSVPTRVGTATDWASVHTTGASTVALRSDGSLWAWGGGTPTRVGTDTWSAVSIAGHMRNYEHHTHTLAIRSDGTLWAWGDNTYGQLGLPGDRVYRPFPVQVSAETGWVKVVAGPSSSIALRRP